MKRMQTKEHTLQTSFFTLFINSFLFFLSLGEWGLQGCDGKQGEGGINRQDTAHAKNLPSSVSRKPSLTGAAKALSTPSKASIKTSFKALRSGR